MSFFIRLSEYVIEIVFNRFAELVNADVSDFSDCPVYGSYVSRFMTVISDGTLIW